jgi:hypothetical protein
MTMTDSDIRQYCATHDHTKNIPNAEGARARRAAHQCGLWVRKSRQHRHMNNFGGYQLIDDRNNVVAGANFELNADDVLVFCQQWAQRETNSPSCSR